MAVVNVWLRLFRDQDRRTTTTTEGVGKDHVNPLRTAVPFWGQTTQISSSLSPKRDCGPKGVNILRCRRPFSFRTYDVRRDVLKSRKRDRSPHRTYHEVLVHSRVYLARGADVVDGRSTSARGNVRAPSAPVLLSVLLFTTHELSAANSKLRSSFVTGYLVPGTFFANRLRTE